MGPRSWTDPAPDCLSHAFHPGSSTNRPSPCTECPGVQQSGLPSTLFWARAPSPLLLAQVAPLRHQCPLFCCLLPASESSSADTPVCVGLVSRLGAWVSVATVCQRLRGFIRYYPTPTCMCHGPWRAGGKASEQSNCWRPSQPSLFLADHIEVWPSVPLGTTLSPQLHVPHQVRGTGPLSCSPSGFREEPWAEGQPQPGLGVQQEGPRGRSWECMEAVGALCPGTLLSAMSAAPGKGPGCPCTSLSACRETLLELGGPGAGTWGPYHSPSLATSPMGTLCFWAMYPRKEKTTKPEEKLVSELTEVVMIASLQEQDTLSQPGWAPLQFPVIIHNWLCLVPAAGGAPQTGRPAPPVTPEPVPGCPAGGRLAPADSGACPTCTPR